MSTSLLTLEPVRAAMTDLLRQCAERGCQAWCGEDDQEHLVYANDQVVIDGRSPLSLDQLDFLQLAHLAQAAATELSLTDEQRARQERQLSDDVLYAQRKTAANPFAFDDRVCPQPYKIVAASDWQQTDTENWYQDVTLQHNGGGPDALARLDVHFRAGEAVVVAAQLQLQKHSKPFAQYTRSARA